MKKIFISIALLCSVFACSKDYKLFRMTGICDFKNAHDVKVLQQTLNHASATGYTHVIDLQCGQEDADALPIDVVMADMVRIEREMLGAN